MVPGGEEAVGANRSRPVPALIPLRVRPDAPLCSRVRWAVEPHHDAQSPEVPTQRLSMRKGKSDSGSELPLRLSPPRQMPSPRTRCRCRRTCPRRPAATPAAPVRSRADPSPCVSPPPSREAESLSGIVAKGTCCCPAVGGAGMTSPNKQVVAGCNSGRSPSRGASSVWWSKKRTLSTQRFSVFRIGQSSRTSRGSSSRRRGAPSPRDLQVPVPDRPIRRRTQTGSWALEVTKAAKCRGVVDRRALREGSPGPWRPRAGLPQPSVPERSRRSSWPQEALPPETRGGR